MVAVKERRDRQSLERGLLLSDEKEECTIAAHWERVCQRLLGWLARPRATDEEGWESPSTEATISADKLAQALQSYRPGTTFSVSSDGEGGISFESRIGVVTERFEIDSTGGVEYLALRDSVLTERTPIDVE